ncbi:outer membrane lipoprotein LolB [Geomonas sp. RF6]|uniref:lipoprotein insertase outer membrane protein LolB n=1 Tax=Geomonas sp. RF6 TaxID=2897342 RepID=UPI001E42B926|nr:lipoprotein insertase outer membrane protein LolB [Geomonas sp. RF6]UFS71519.1 outer membrane lipoprotein LolB [Geomonas sp. RF6]
MTCSPRFPMRYRLLLILFLLILSGCATARPPLKATPGVSVETLRSDVAVAVSGARSGSARGYLVFKRPDRLHVAILSPFGTSLLELFSEGEKIVCILPSKMTAYSGTAADLAARGLLAEWSLLQWVLAPAPTAENGAPGTETVSADGRKEQVFFYDNGLVERKVADGVEVLYKDYREVDGVPFAERVEITGVGGDRVTIAFDEPEVNRPIEEDVLAPKLQGYQLLPLASFPSKL